MLKNLNINTFSDLIDKGLMELVIIQVMFMNVKPDTKNSISASILYKYFA